MYATNVNMAKSFLVDLLNKYEVGFKGYFDGINGRNVHIHIKPGVYCKW